MTQSPTPASGPAAKPWYQRRWGMVVIAAGAVSAATTTMAMGRIRTLPGLRSSRTAGDPAARRCRSAYPGACLLTGTGDYDCAGRGENGPNYATRSVQVLPPDPFRLDRDHDGTACEDR